MELSFDISQDELPIFLAEVDEHLQTLDEILVQLEQLDSSSELLHTVFRAAHTLKGMAGIIGHTRMTRLTHALETALDGIRKNTIPMNSPLIDLCLDAVDGLRLLREEVVTNLACDVDVERLLVGFQTLNQPGKDKTPAAKKIKKAAHLAMPVVSHAPVQARKETPARTMAPPAVLAAPGSHDVQVPRLVHVYAKIESGSIATAARAFQLMMVLQELGEITSMTPTQAQIETANPVAEFSADLLTSCATETIYRQLQLVSDIELLNVEAALSPFENILTTERPLPNLAEQAQEEEEDKPGKDSPAGSAPVEVPGQDPRSRANNKRHGDMTVRTSVERLDVLMNLVGELITDRNHMLQIRNRMEIEARGNFNVEKLAETVAHLGRITDQLQEEVMHIRMLPIGNMFHKFPRMVRDMAQLVNKQIDLVIHGEDTELDRSMIEEINDPLIHLVRNSVDHGIESSEDRLAAGKPERGTITLNARHEQGRIILTVEDDGRGIDPEKIRRSAVQKGLISAEEAANLTEEQSIDLIFLPGLSTAQKVSDISGRGVGMDIVNTNIQHVNGTIVVETHLGRGSQFQIILPLTLAIVPTLLVHTNGATFAIPLVMVVETLRLKDNDIQTIGGKPVSLLRGSVLPLIYLSEIFDFPRSGSPKSSLYAVVVSSGKQRVGLIVDSFTGEEEVVVKSLSSLVGDIPGISSAAILGDGKIALIVDVPGLFKLAGIH